MAAPLTWQDVAGQVNVTNYADTSALITQGIAGVGDAVAKLGGAKDQRRKADLANQMLILDMQAEAKQKQAALGNQLSKDFEAKEEKKYAKEFGANQSALEELARNTIANGGTIDEVLKSDLYQNLSEGARSFAGATLSDAAYQGTVLRDRREETAQNNRVQLAQLNIQQAAAQRAIEADKRSRELHEFTIAENERQQAAAAEAELAARGGLRPDVDETTDSAIGALRNKVGNDLARITGARFTGQSVSEVAKKAGFDDFSDLSKRFNKINRNRAEQGKEALPDTMLAAMLDKQDGKNTWFKMYDTLDEQAFDRVLEYNASLYDRVLAEQAELIKWTAYANSGRTVMDSWIVRDLNKIPPAMAAPRGPTIPTRPRGVYPGK
jgi:hypothetical protein